MKLKDKEKLNNPLKSRQILSSISSMVFHTVQWSHNFTCLSCGLANWESTFFSKTQLCSTKAFTVRIPHNYVVYLARLWCHWQSLTSLECLTGIWSHGQTFRSPTSLRCSWQLSDDPGTSVMFLTPQCCLQNVSCFPDTSLVSLTCSQAKHKQANNTM